MNVATASMKKRMDNSFFIGFINLGRRLWPQVGKRFSLCRMHSLNDGELFRGERHGHLLMFEVSFVYISFDKKLSFLLRSFYLNKWSTPRLSPNGSSFATCSASPFQILHRIDQIREKIAMDILVVAPFTDGV